MAKTLVPPSSSNLQTIYKRSKTGSFDEIPAAILLVTVTTQPDISDLRHHPNRSLPLRFGPRRHRRLRSKAPTISLLSDTRCAGSCFPETYRGQKNPQDSTPERHVR